MKGTARNEKIGRLSEITVRERELFEESLELERKKRLSNISLFERQEIDERLRAIGKEEKQLSRECQEILDAIDADDEARKRRRARIQVSLRATRWLLTVVAVVSLILIIIG